MYTIIIICDRSNINIVKTDKTYLEAIELANEFLKNYLKEENITEQSEIDKLIKDKKLEFMTIKNENCWYNGETHNLNMYLIV